MNTTPLKTFLIPDEMCRRVGIAATFISANELGVYPSQLVKQTVTNAPSPYSTNTEAKIFHFCPEVILYHPILRRLLNESSGIFLNLQTHVSDVLTNKQMIQFSIQYRSVIRACLENLKEELMQTNCMEKELLQNYITIFYSVECLWHLCEILFLQETTAGKMIGTRLLNWVRFHIPKYERRAAQILHNYMSMGIESEEDYWPTIIGCLLQGRVDEVRLLLDMHSNASTQPFRVASLVLKTMPTYDTLANEGMTLTQFNLRRKHWLVDTQAKIDSMEFYGEKNINFIMRLVVGEELAWNEVRKHCEVWYELLAAWIFYTDPTLKTYELGKYAKKCITRMEVQMKQIDHVILAAMHKDIDLIKKIQHMNDNGWFVTHLIDLLYHSKHLDAWQTKDTSAAKLRESFLLEYGTLLMEHNSLWQIGLNYMDNCPHKGQAIIALLLPRIATTEAKALKVIREAAKRRLFHIAHSTAKVQYSYYIKHNRYGNALVWAMKAQDPESISHIVNKILRQYKETYVLPHEDVFNNLGASMLACDSLIFLGKYYEYRSNMDAQNYTEAANALVALIGSKFTPKFFCDVMLTETLRLLESTNHAIDSNSGIIIMNYLDERSDQEELADKSQMIRMALARRLSNAFTMNKKHLK